MVSPDPSRRWCTTYWKILLVGEDQEESITEFILVQHALQLFPSLDNTISVVGVDNEDDTLGILEVVSPERANLVLSTNIPHGELDVLVFDRLDVEAWRRVSSRIRSSVAPRRTDCGNCSTMVLSVLAANDKCVVHTQSHQA